MKIFLSITVVLAVVKQTDDSHGKRIFDRWVTVHRNMDLTDISLCSLVPSIAIGDTEKAYYALSS